MPKTNSTQRRGDTDKNPWACTDPLMKGCIIGTVYDRCYEVKQSTDVKWLISALLWPDTQPAIAKDIKTRLVKLYAEKTERSRLHPEANFKDAIVGQFYFWVFLSAEKEMRYKFNKRCLVLCDKDGDGDLRFNLLNDAGEVKESYYAGNGLGGKLYGPVIVPLR